MPLYEYECAKCEKIHEVIQKFSDAPLEVCPDCEAPIKKLLSRTGFALKGSGWYTTDYKRASAPAAAQPKADSKPAETCATTGEAKPAGGCGTGACTT